MPYNFDGPNDLYGVFNEEKSIYIGDPYDKGYTGNTTMLSTDVALHQLQPYPLHLIIMSGLVALLNCVLLRGVCNRVVPPQGQAVLSPLPAQGPWGGCHD
jgi:hypothetical protein